MSCLLNASLHVITVKYRVRPLYTRGRKPNLCPTVPGNSGMTQSQCFSFKLCWTRISFGRQKTDGLLAVTTYMLHFNPFLFPWFRLYYCHTSRESKVSLIYLKRSCQPNKSHLSLQNWVTINLRKSKLFENLFFSLPQGGVYYAHFL